MADQIPHPNPYPTQPMIDDDEIDLLELWDILVDKWQWIVGITSLSAIAAIVVALMMTPVYRAAVVMVPADDAGGKVSALASQFGGLADLAGVNLGGGGGGKGEAMAMLKSRTLIESFIKENDLLPVLFEDAWDATANKWKTDDPKAMPTMNKAYELIESILQISEDKKTGVITLAVDWKDRLKTAEWANDIVQRANQTMRDRAIGEAQASIDYLHKELAKTSVVEIQQAIYRLLEANYKTTSIANAREQYAFKVIDPAVAADEGRKVKPKRSLIVILATLAGGFISVLGVFLHRGLQTLRQRRAQKQA